MTREAQTIKALVEALEDAAQHIRQLRCTCLDGGNSDHDRRQPLCSGERHARRYEALTRRIRRRMATQEPRQAG